MSLLALHQRQDISAVRSRASPERSPAAAIWLFGVAAIVICMVVVGGATRLTGSGLSITEWKPVTGALPPLTQAAWRRLFALYQATPQYRLVNRGMELGDFQFIFWWEWAHRLLGRLLGAVFLLPFIVLVATRRLPPRLLVRCVGLFLLGGLQGAVGWWMVKSGLEDRVSVAPERLATHLGLALCLFVLLIWTGLEAWSGPSRSGPSRQVSAWSRLTALFAGAVYVQCLMGALVAGNHAGLIDGDWPLMAGRFMPADYWQGSLVSTLVHGLSAVQFNHRMMAYALLVGGLALAAGLARSRAAPRELRFACWLVAGVLVVQVALGIATLRWGVPLPLALLHQLTACALLAGATFLAWKARRSLAVSCYHLD